MSETAPQIGASFDIVDPVSHVRLAWSKPQKSRLGHHRHHRDAIARFDESWEVTGREDSRHFCSDLQRDLSGPAGKMDACNNLAIFHLFAEIDHGFDHAVVLSEGEAITGRHVEPLGSALLDRASNDAGVAQHIENAAPRDPNGLRTRGTTAAKLRADENLAHFLDRGLLEPPLFVQTIFGVLGGIGPHAEDLAHMRRTADRLFGKDYQWSILAAGRHQISLATVGATMGGNVRVGLEDSIYLGPGRLAKSNAEQVRKIRGILAELSLDIATPAEAREMLKLKGGDRVAF